MTITIPDHLAHELGQQPAEVERRVMEAVALEGYREGRFSAGFVGRVLGLSLWGAEAFLDGHGARNSYTTDMLHEDRRTLGNLGRQ